MAGLSRVFKMATTRYTDALDKNDVEDMDRLRQKKEHWLGYYHTHIGAHSKLSVEMATLFVDKFTDENWQRWGYKAGARAVVLDQMMCNAMAAGREDLFDIYFGAGIPFNTGRASQHVIHYTLKSELGDAKKSGFIKRLLESGIDKVSGNDHFARFAVEKNCPQSFDLLVAATKEDVHRDNESLLRLAAEHGNVDMCRHLVEKHGANLELAITTDRTLGREKGWLFLEDLRKALRPNDAPPPTIESLSRRVEQLEATVRELTEALKKPQPSPVTAPTPAR